MIQSRAVRKAMLRSMALLFSFVAKGEDKSLTLHFNKSAIQATVTRHWNNKKNMAHIQLSLKDEKKAYSVKGGFASTLIPSSFESDDNLKIETLRLKTGEDVGLSIFHQIERWHGIRYLIVPEFSKNKLDHFKFLQCDDYSEGVFKSSEQQIDIWCRSYRHGEFGADAQSILSRIRIEKEDNKSKAPSYNLKKISIGMDENEWPQEEKDGYPSREFPALFVAACRENNAPLMEYVIHKHFKAKNNFGLKRVPDSLEKAMSFVQKAKMRLPLECDPK